jgi:predicted Zn-dependent protease
MSKRLNMLEQLTASGKADAFTWYALALEYKSAGRHADALRTFRALRDLDRDYVPMYLMAGSMLVETGALEDARAWLTAGIARAQAVGNDHARSEMEGILAAIEE